MTDLPDLELGVPARLGSTARFEDGRLIIDVAPQPATLRFGIIRTSVVFFAVDAVAGISVDSDPDVWTLTSDMSVRMLPLPAPRRISAVATILRQGRRSVTCAVELTTDDGEPAGSGVLGFVHVPRRDGDPPKPAMTPERAAQMFVGLPPLEHPVREEAGIQVIDPAEGVVEMVVTPRVTNPVGTLQGAMVALLAEAAAEDLLEHRFGRPVVVTDLDLRYLGQAHQGPVRTRCRLVGDGPDATVEVQLVDTSTGRITTHVYVRAVPVPVP